MKGVRFYLTLFCLLFSPIRLGSAALNISAATNSRVLPQSSDIGWAPVTCL